jgi:hypothetical protein
MASVVAMKESRFIVMLSFSINELTQKHPELHEKILKIIKERVENNKITEVKNH